MNLPHCPALLLACLLGTAGSLAMAQSASPAAPAASAAKDSKEAKAEAEAAAAMERARRMAANPMRVILEASRVRRRADAEPAPGPGPLLPVAAGTAAAAAPAPAPAPEIAPRAVPAPPRDSAAPEPAAVISSELVQARSAAAPAPALDLAPTARAVAAPAVGLAPLAELQPEIARPTLVSKVDPDLPARLLIELNPNTVITADLTIKPDGSVSQVVIVTPPTPSTRPLGRYIVTALQQWRFAPLSGERVWRVDLVLRADE